MLLRQCGENKVFENEVEAYLEYKDTVMVYKAKNGDLIEYNTSLEISEKTLRMMNDSLSEALDNIGIKKPEVIIQFKERIVLKEVEIRFTDSIPCDPFFMPFRKSEPFYLISGSVKNNGITLDSIYMPNSQSVVLGTKKNGLFKKNDHIVTVQNTNPYITTTGITSYTIKDRKKWFQTGWFKFGAGVVGGLTLYRIVNK